MSWRQKGTVVKLSELTKKYVCRPHTISETADAVQCRHLDDESKQVVDECVEGLVAEHAPRQMGHRLEFVVDEQLGGHHDEACKDNRVLNLVHIKHICFVFSLQRQVHRKARHIIIAIARQ